MTTTNKQDAAISALRGEADQHGDSKTVALCDAALAGDVSARAKLAAQLKGVKAARKPSGAASRPSPWRAGVRASSHPWAHDEE